MTLRRPTLVGALIGKIAAATGIVPQSAAAQTKHVRDLDSLARLLGPDDRDGANLTSAFGGDAALSSALAVLSARSGADRVTASARYQADRSGA